MELLGNLLAKSLQQGAHAGSCHRGLFSLVTVLARQLSRGGQIPVEATAWYQKPEATFSDCLTLVRRHLWQARYLVNSVPKAEYGQLPREAFDCLLPTSH